jgi:hypothetical protein
MRQRQAFVRGWHFSLARPPNAIMRPKYRRFDLVDQCLDCGGEVVGEPDRHVCVDYPRAAYRLAPRQHVFRRDGRIRAAGGFGFELWWWPCGSRHVGVHP